jgi:hypothetical protein
MITGALPTFLDTFTSVAIVLGGGAVGGLSGVISLRRYLSI